MINKLSLWRVEPCFMASKRGCGDVSRVKKGQKNTQQVQYPTQKTEHVDTFTSSKNEEKKSVPKNNTNKTTHKGNC